MYECEPVPHVSPPALYRAVGRCGLLELTPDFSHCPAILRGLVASTSEQAQGKSWQPDEAVSAATLSVIVIPTALNCAKWAQRSKEDAEFVGDF